MRSNFDQLFATLPHDMLITMELAPKPVDIPRLPEAQCIVLPIVRESIAPLAVRNNDPDLITDMFLANQNRIRMIASKTKAVERRRGAQILRYLGLGGFAPANKAHRPSGVPMSQVFDMNTFVFGDAAKGSGNAIYPVHAAVLYSDALSVETLTGQIDSVFRQGGIYEDGGNYDAKNERSSSNIFTSYTVKPGTHFVQTLVLTGNRITPEAFDHLLLSLGLAGAYGGATATTGTNMMSKIVGIYWGTLERPINAPGQILSQLSPSENIQDHVAELFRHAYPHEITGNEVANYIDNLITKLEQKDPALLRSYGVGASQAAELFDRWFKESKGSGKKQKKTSEAAVSDEAKA